MVANDWTAHAKFPHCDQRVLHKPGTCQFCDAYPDRQELRKDWKIAFTGETPKDGELPCPSDAARGRGGAHVWGGNRPLTAPNPTNGTTPNPTNNTTSWVDTPTRIPLWKCRECGCLWRDNLDGTVSLFGPAEQSCQYCESQDIAKACEPVWYDAIVRTLPDGNTSTFVVKKNSESMVIPTAAGLMCSVCEHGVDCWLTSDVSPCNESCAGYRARRALLWQKEASQEVPGKPGVYIGGCSSIFAKKPDVAPVDRSNVCTTSGDDAAEVRERQQHEGNDGQHSSYITLCDTERKKGFVRPLRASYKHVGERPKYPLRPLTQEEQVRYVDAKYVVYEMYPKPLGSVLGRFWTAQQLQGGCQTVTTMGLALAETYARDPKFYGSTFCCHCNTHRPVAEFVWLDDETVVGS